MNRFLVLIYFFLFSFLPTLHGIRGGLFFSKVNLVASIQDRSKSNSKPKFNANIKSPNVFAAALAGAFSCSSTHTLLVPLDIVKTKLQNCHNCLQPVTTTSVLRDIISTHGISGLFSGWSATAFGYLLQGTFKFGFYDYFKYLAKKLPITAARSTTLPVLLSCSGLAEVFASISLCPLEGTKIFMVNHPDIAKKGLAHSMQHIMKTRGISGFFSGLPWVLLRQVPYTCVKLAGYDSLVRFIEDNIHQYYPTINKLMYKHHPKSPEEIIRSWKLAIQLTCGVFAGIMAAVISQPADVILTKVYSRSEGGRGPLSLVNIIKSVGLKNSFAGIKERSIMVATITALQFMVYENSKDFIITQMDQQLLKNNPFLTINRLEDTKQQIC